MISLVSIFILGEVTSMMVLMAYDQHHWHHYHHSHDHQHVHPSTTTALTTTATSTSTTLTTTTSTTSIMIAACFRESGAEAYARVTFLIGKMHLIQSFAYWLVPPAIACTTVKSGAKRL